MGHRFEGKVVLVTGAARGQGRSHAVRFAAEGADIVALDICRPINSVPYELATPADLEETVAQVEKLDRRIVAVQADVRDTAQITAALDAGVDAFGGIDICSANAGINSFRPLAQITDEAWQDVIDTNLTGVFKTIRAVVPSMRERGGGSIVITSSVAGLRGMPNIGHYAAAKHGLVGLARSFAIELANDNIRVNTVHPTGVNTPMIANEATYRLFLPDAESPTHDEFAEASKFLHLLSIPWVEAADVTSAVLWLASDEARYITGVALPVDGGAAAK